MKKARRVNWLLVGARDITCRLRRRRDRPHRRRSNVGLVHGMYAVAGVRPAAAFCFEFDFCRFRLPDAPVRSIFTPKVRLDCLNEEIGWDMKVMRQRARVTLANPALAV